MKTNKKKPLGGKFCLGDIRLNTVKGEKIYKTIEEEDRQFQILKRIYKIKN